MENPLISIVIPVYNAAKYIEETIHNFLNQTYQNIEIIVQDDRSKDGTWEVLTGKFGNHSKVKLRQNEQNQGIGKNWNEAYNRATGELVVIANADDVHFPGFLEKAVYDLQEFEVDFVSFKYQILYEADGSKDFTSVNRHLHSGRMDNVFEIVFNNNPFHIIFTLFKKQLIDKVKVNSGAFLNTQVCDFELVLRYAYSYRFYYDETCMGYYRIHTTNNSGIPLAELTSYYTDVVPLWHERTKKKVGKRKYRGHHLNQLKIYLKKLAKRQVPYNPFIIRSCLKYALG